MGSTLKNERADMDDIYDLISPIYKDTYMFVYSILKNKEIAQDALQNAIIRASEKIDQLKDESKFKQWFFTIAKTEALAIIRADRKYKSIDKNVIEFYNDKVIDPPEEVLIRREIGDKLIKYINELDSKYRDVIIMRYYNDLSFSEISKVLNKNNNTVRCLHKRAKEMLLKKMEGA